MSIRKFSTGSRRDTDRNKAPFSRLPFAALEQVSLVHLHGDNKYGLGNWRKGQPFSELSNSAWRHWERWFVYGEEKDSKSGLHHIAHCAWNVLILLYHCVFYNPKLDDRQKPNGDWLSKEFAKTKEAKKLEKGNG
jgi:hypothetical protein